jgi:hypothetical protein
MVVAKRRGRPPSKVAINKEAIAANSALKESKQRILDLESHVTFLEITFEEMQERLQKLNEELAAEKENNYKLARHNESLVVVIQYLEGKVFPQ